VLAAGIAHEINNPMAILMGYNGILESKLKLLPNAEQLLSFLHKQNHAIERVASIIEGLRSFADGFNEPLATIDLNEVVKATLPLCAALFDKGKARLEIDTQAEKIWIHANQTQIQHVVLTLLTNAYDAVAETTQGLVVLKTGIDAEEAFILVRDNGSGIEPGNMERIFDPFFTTKEAGKGSGLGLFVANSMLQQMHAYFKVESTLAEGSSFIAKFPRVPVPKHADD
jgi:C4-dicarboxylate-specific signal transduction histidine kinase